MLDMILIYVIISTYAPKYDSKFLRFSDGSLVTILYVYLQEEMGRVRHDFENILEEKLALDTEIAVYRGLIEAEERRLAK